MKLKKQIEFYLDLRGINATRLSRITGVPRQNLSNWMMGQFPKDIRQVKKVADYFKVSLDHLLFGEGKFEDDNELTDFDRALKGQFEIRIRKIL